MYFFLFERRFYRDFLNYELKKYVSVVRTLSASFLVICLHLRDFLSLRFSVINQVKIRNNFLVLSPYKIWQLETPQIVSSITIRRNEVFNIFISSL